MKPSWKGRTMSKLGDFNLALQEQAEELGFETTQQALDAGCEIGGDSINPILIEPLEAAHNAWEAEKKILLNDLNKVRELFPKMTGYSNWSDAVLEKAIKWIEEAHE